MASTSSSPSRLPPPLLPQPITPTTLISINPSITLTLFVILTLSLLVYNVALAIYRVTFHPLARFPGPKLAAISGWYEFYHDIVRRGCFMWHIRELHEQYGPIVRVTPHELHILDPQFFDEIYAPSSTSSSSASSKRRDKWTGFTVMAGAPGATFSTAAHDLHRLRRGVLNPFFSKRSIARNEGLIMEKVGLLCRRFEEVVEVNGGGEAVIRVDAAYSALTMDIISLYAFGSSSNQLNEPDWKLSWKESIVGASANAVVLRQFPWALPILQSIPLPILRKLDPRAAQVVEWQHAMRVQIDEIFANQASVAEKRKGPNRETERTTIFQAILDSDELPPHEKSPQRLTDEAQTVVGAGSETTAKALSFITFFLYSDPMKLRRLRAELEGVEKTSIAALEDHFPLAKLEQLPYLTACITEGIRMTSGVTARLPRVASEPIPYHDFTIPPGTPISQCHYFVNNDPEIFPEPLQYRPERWLHRTVPTRIINPTTITTAVIEEANPRLEKYMVSFGRGSRSCVGINLAWAELYLTLAHVVTRFDMAPFETTSERDVCIDRDFFIGVPREGSMGVRMMVRVR